MNTPLETYFAKFRKNVVGSDLQFTTPYGTQPLVYADWTASGRLYEPIERRISQELGPYVGNTHTETTLTGSAMTLAYHQSLEIIKQHVNANTRDVILTCDSGMTGAVNKLQRILGLRIHEAYKDHVRILEDYRPVVFVTHLEHHSNHTSWLETIAEVICIAPDTQGNVDLEDLKRLLQQYAHRKIRIAAVSSGSNVTGIQPPYYEIARIMHQHKGLCFVDFACSGPYVEIDMHPADDPLAKLDAIYFSPHKFLGGPGTPGIVIFDSHLYTNQIPDQPGGGTVSFTNPWGQHRYLNNIESREDGGTPPFLQTIKAAMCMQLKAEMGVDNMLAREKEIMALLWEELTEIDGLTILANHIKERLGIISFYIDGLHYNLAVRLLNDRFGIQVRGGCSCAGTYGHYLLNINQEASQEMVTEIEKGNFTIRPGWIRLSIHPIMTNEEARYLAESIRELCLHHRAWAQDYRYQPAHNEYIHRTASDWVSEKVQEWLYEPLSETLEEKAR